MSKARRWVWVGALCWLFTCLVVSWFIGLAAETRRDSFLWGASLAWACAGLFGLFAARKETRRP